MNKALVAVSALALAANAYSINGHMIGKFIKPDSGWLFVLLFTGD